MSTPRLHLHNVQRNGTEEFLGSFADGPRGRLEAKEALKSSERQDHNLQNSIERDQSNPHRVPGEEHPNEGLLTDHVRIERVFSRDQVQQLVRIPGVDEYSPKTFEESQKLEAKCVDAFLRKRADSYPITKAEASAYEFAKRDPQGAMEKADQLAANRLALEDASARANALDKLLPRVQVQSPNQTDDWHPGMTAPAIAAPEATESNAQQIQTRSRSQGLRF